MNKHQKSCTSPPECRCTADNLAQHLSLKQIQVYFYLHYSAVMSETKTSTLDAPNTPGQYLLSYPSSLLCIPVLLHPGSRTGPAGDGDSGSGYVLWHEPSAPGLAQSLLLPWTLQNLVKPPEKSLPKKSDILSIFLRQHKTVLSWGRCSLYPLCSPDPPAKQEAQHYPATTDPTVSVYCDYFITPLICFHQAAAWWTEPKEMRACMQEGISISQIPEFGVFSFLLLQ